MRGHLLTTTRSCARKSDPSPVPPRLVKAPAAVHPLPTGEGYDRLAFFCLVSTVSDPLFSCLQSTVYRLLPFNSSSSP